MNSKILFGESAKLIKNTVNPSDFKDMPYIGLEHIEQNTLKLSGNGKANEVTSTKLSFKKDDILFGKLRPYFRKVVQAPFDGICSTDIWVVRARKGVDRNFLFYWMASKEFIDEATRGSEGTRMPRAKWEFVSRIECPVTSLNEQKNIGRILKALDDKIELNRQMCKTLEDIASALFKSWFVDFDPVKAKAEGLVPEGLSPEIAKLFPDSFEDSPLNYFPKGWFPSVIYDWCDYINGAAFKNLHFTDKGDGLPVIKIAELKSGISSGTKFSNAVLDKKYTINNGDILLSWSGSPETSIGTFLWVRGKGLLNQHIFKVIPKKDKERPFIYFLLKYFNPTFIKIAKNKQTTGLGHFTVKDLKSLKFIGPDNKLIDEFNTIFKPIFHKIQLTMEEILTLSNLRETLLPQLITGKLQIKDAKQLISSTL